MVTVSFSELLDAFEFASFGGPYESRAYVNLDTGSLHCVSDGIELEEDMPEDIDISDRYVPYRTRTTSILVANCQFRSLSSICRANTTGW